MRARQRGFTLIELLIAVVWSLMPMFSEIVGGSNSSFRQPVSVSVSSRILFSSTRNGIIAKFAFTPLLVLE
jgi:hypothetical protein